MTLGNLVDSDKTSSNLSQYQVQELQSDGKIALFDINTGKPTTFDNIYVIFNDQKINITSKKNHSDVYYTYDEETDSDIGENLEWDYIENNIYGYSDENGYHNFVYGSYEFIIEKDNKEYRGTAMLVPEG